MIPPSTMERMDDQDRLREHRMWLLHCEGKTDTVPFARLLKHRVGGRACVYVQANKLESGDFKVGLSLIMNRIIEETGGMYVMLLDMQGFSMLQNFCPVTLNGLVQHLYKHYPKRLHQVVVLNSGATFSLLLAAVSSMVRESTLRKVRVLGKPEDDDDDLEDVLREVQMQPPRA